MSAPQFFQAKAVSKHYSANRLGGVSNIDLNISQGKITAIIGESGSGKTTLLRLLYGLLSPDEGEIQFKGERIWGPEEKLIPGHDAMRMVTQHTDDLNQFATVWENVAILLPNTDVKAKEEKTRQALKLLNMERLSGSRVFDLSGGEKQRVALARAIITRPEVLLLDEPFNQVDTSFREGLQQDIRQIVEDTGITVIMVSHDPSEILSMADELVVLKDGEILESGTPSALYNAPKYLYTAKLLANCNVLDQDAAKVCGISTQQSHVAIHSEWITITKGIDWQVNAILFKGFYEDILVTKGDITLRLKNFNPGKYQVGERVGLTIDKYLNY